VLKKNTIHFNPPLPMKKQHAIQALGAGIIEKVAVRFSSRFWANKVGDADYFGHVPEDMNTRGLFNMFYDLSSTRVRS
jgi:lysine-specific histone demethylase 1B